MVSVCCLAPVVPFRDLPGKIELIARERGSTHCNPTAGHHQGIKTSRLSEIPQETVWDIRLANSGTSWQRKILIVLEGLSGEDSTEICRK